MADRMRVASLIGGTTALEGPRESYPPGSCRGLRDRVGCGTPNRVSRQVIAATEERPDEFTRRRAGNPGLLWRPARDRADRGPAPGRHRAFPFGPFGERVGLAWTFADAHIGRRQRASVRLNRSVRASNTCGPARVQL